MRVDWCVSSWFRIKNTHSLTRRVGAVRNTPQGSSPAKPRERNLRVTFGAYRASTRARDVFVLLAVGGDAPPGRPTPSQPHHQARGAHGLLSSIRRLLGRRRAPKPPSLLQRHVRAVRRIWLLRSPRRATRVLHARYFAYGSGLRITGGRGLHLAGQQQLHPRRWR